MKRLWSRLGQMTRSLRYRIFISMFVILVLSSVIIFITSIIQYREEAKDYNYKRLERKEKALRESINLVLRKTMFPVTTEYLPLIFKEEIHQLANVHNLNFEIYDLEGRLLVSSAGGFGKDTVMSLIPPKILDELAKTPDKKLKIEEKNVQGDFISAYSYITDAKYKPIGILHIPYRSKSDFYEYEIKEFLSRMAKVYIFLLLVAIAISFVVSKNLIKSLSVISDKLKETDIAKGNQKLEIRRLPDELQPLIDAYNQMVDKLERSTKQLIRMEKEAAWGEMARQVAHEIRNPLTPMRLSIEHFLQTFRPGDPGNAERVRQFGEMLLEQVDVLNRIARSFSEYTKISELDFTYDNIVDTIRNTVMLFPGHARYEGEDEIYTLYDKGRIKQALVNLIRNAIQATREGEQPDVVVRAYVKEEHVYIEVEDKGTGIPPEVLEHIFEPRFTTKSSGTGLGLSIVRRIVEKHEGRISVETYQGKGTKFILILPLKKPDHEIQ
ncbi:MAG: HAMP domain-containing histidine kinase [Chlorobi bacterium]|nr:HAMP domain-containing histidine kinase [Chlorobiota bacterium]